ncbi:hypothetical protein [Deinococcus sp. Leaf326]|jgi:uncharacterized glyoxalase superfamily metalloenzyme YdcJ|nr:hypothetical protein [Deinococcus sp. Leaf326]
MKSTRVAAASLLALVVTVFSVAGASPVGGYGLEKAPTSARAAASAS